LEGCVGAGQLLVLSTVRVGRARCAHC
jgi:hypothetical protein